ncbi:hypothetical protein OXV40_23590 [Burkholderia contaminans]|uniref:Uncharacterized protein n=1 Tax=Burkholderia contaminans TaxID=488447 RepID=A0ABD7Y094_9BURK|nr:MULTISPECIES: hypothetical protein [Burkholderia]MBH9692169.1 hypothetical protein [Burkholderia contaminans]MBK1923536.1 hypothetical protein [Burkholderia contaminans]MBK1941494.1 hypothetical protein [Burkholderia contaminans]MBK1957740.1 hypothetical protein [Burkholderia contaminans]MBO1848431.1 hypothetical protein [Burkholderia contaminans]
MSIKGTATPAPDATSVGGASHDEGRWAMRAQPSLCRLRSRQGEGDDDVA